MFSFHSYNIIVILIIILLHEQYVVFVLSKPSIHGLSNSITTIHTKNVMNRNLDSYKSLESLKIRGGEVISGKKVSYIMIYNLL